MSPISCSYLWHVSFTCVTCLIRVSIMSRPRVWRVSFILHVSFTCVTCLIHMACLIHVCDMPHSYVWPVSFICVILSHSYVWHVSFICLSCLIHMFVMSHSYLYMWSRARCSHTRTTHTTHTTHTHTPSENEWVILHLWMSHATSMSASCHLYAWVTFLVCISHVTQGCRFGG